MSLLKKLAKTLLPGPWRTPLKQAFLKVRYRGRKYYCPVCRSHTRLQQPLGFDFPVIVEKQIVGGGIRTALCPVCASSDRIRLLYLFLQNKTPLFTDKIRLLHFAPEPALQQIIEKYRNVNYLTADLYQENVMEKIDITAIPHPDNSFDAVLCNHVLEHIPDDAKAMSELYRVLKPGGWAILQVPFSKVLDKTFEDPTVTSEAERERVFGQKDHVRIYGKDYPARLRAAGFRVTPFDWTTAEDASFKKSGLNLNPQEPVFYCEK